MLGAIRHEIADVTAGLFMMSAAVGAVLIQFGIGWPLLLMSVVFSLAMIPLLFGDHQSK